MSFRPPSMSSSPQTVYYQHSVATLFTPITPVHSPSHTLTICPIHFSLNYSFSSFHFQPEALTYMYSIPSHIMHSDLFYAYSPYHFQTPSPPFSSYCKEHTNALDCLQTVTLLRLTPQFHILLVLLCNQLTCSM